jgi:hypothetical protein
VELAEMVGISANNIYVIMSHNKKRGVEGRFVKVMIDDDEEGE